MRRAVAQVTGAVLYLRVSTARQVAEGVSLDAQDAACRRHAERLDLPVVAVFRDGISGKDGIADRPGLAAALEACRSHQNVLVAYSVSRIARRQRLLWNLLDPEGDVGLRISSATEPFDTSTPMGRAMLGMIGVWSQLEADMVSQRTRDALAYVRSQGKRLGRPPEPLPEHTYNRACVLRYDCKCSWRVVAQRLTDEGCPAARGGFLHDPKTIRIALRRTREIIEARRETPRS